MNNWINKYKNNYQDLPQIINVKKLWHHDYNDGPLSGVCEVDGQKCWFEIVDEWIDHNIYPIYDKNFYPPWWRRYLIHRLTDQQFNNINIRHNKFRIMVGTHTDFDENGNYLNCFHYNKTITPETVSQYYKELINEVFPDISPVSDECVIGWFEWV